MENTQVVAADLWFSNKAAYRPEQEQYIQVRSSVQPEAEAKRGRAEPLKECPHVNKEDGRCTETVGERGVVGGTDGGEGMESILPGL